MGLSWTRTPELAAPVVRRRRYEVRHPEAAARQATSWLRSHEGVGRADARLLLALAGHHLSNLAVARGRRTRGGARGGRQEGLRDHRHRTDVLGRAQGYRRRHLRSRDGNRRAYGWWLDGGSEPGARPAREGRVPHRLEGRERRGA